MWVGVLEVLQRTLGVFEAGGGLPSGVVEWIALPLDEVLELIAVPAPIEDLFDRILELVVDDVRWRRWVAARQRRAVGGVVVWLEEGDVEDWMKCRHRVREVEPVGD